MSDELSIMSDEHAIHLSQQARRFSFLRRWRKPKNVIDVVVFNKGASSRLPTTDDPLGVGQHGHGGLYDPFSSSFQKSKV
jgi:hypothetical protein